VYNSIGYVVLVVMGIIAITTIVLIVKYAIPYIFNMLIPFFLDYKFSPDGIDIVIIGRRLKVYRICRRNIKYVEVLDKSNYKDLFDMRGTWSFKLVNRFTRYLLFVQTTGFVSWVLSPVDSAAAVKLLHIKNNVKLWS
jgi:hypothetical protein